jgi:DNA topoisomerase IA
VDRVKTLVIAEKPSVARDLADALPGTFENHDSYLESEDTVITFAVGHLVQLIDPEDYDERFKRWRMDDLPIVPEEFQLRARDKKAEKQLKVIHKLLKRDDVDRVVNACDAGREGELIFAYILQTAMANAGPEEGARVGTRGSPMLSTVDRTCRRPIPLRTLGVPRKGGGRVSDSSSTGSGGTSG